ncbi:MAG: hypothetical protein EOO38_31055 [Cytophagaceae bacterium]|nr:MAG: hypothetical protein EOO38_31055 [Cytophagaceae bacterium]
MPPSPYDTSADACNGAVENCVAQWCDVVYPTTHLSNIDNLPFANVPWPLSEVGRFASNQARTLEQQFGDGIRGFMLEFYENKKGEIRSSHNTVWDGGLLEDDMRKFNQLLAKNPGNHILVKLSPQQHLYNQTKLLEVVERSGLGARTMQQVCGGKYNTTALTKPDCIFTMGSLLANGVQATIITSSLQNKYNASTLNEMSCMADETTESNNSKLDVVVWNAFVSLALRTVSDVVNPFLDSFVERCASGKAEGIKTPTMLAVNHYESSNVVQIAHTLNTGVKKRTGYAIGC